MTDVDPEAIFAASREAARSGTSASAAVTELANLLKQSGGMAGTDDAGHEWALKYDPFCGGRDGAAGLMEAATTVIMAAGQCSDLLNATAVNHLNADQQSAINSPDALAFPDTAAPTFLVPAIPSAEGGHDDVPEWWHTISAYVEGQVWPNGHQDQLRAASDAWHKAAGELRTAAQIFDGDTRSLGVIAPLMEQQSPEFEAARTNCIAVRDSMKAVADGFDVAGTACSDYAQNIDDVHSAIIHEMLVLGATVAVTEAFAAILIPFTFGTSEAVGKVVDVARLVATGSRIATLIREFRVAAEASSLPTVSAAATATRAITELAPLLAARVQLLLTEGTTGLLGAAGLELLSRPYIRVGVRREVEDLAPKSPDGLYYISAADRNIWIPVSKQYDEAILALPRTADGKYYFDAATGIRYPVNPTYQLGHVPGEEWWRIRDLAIREGWTRQDLIDYCNNPMLYRIEDAPSNQSHLFELPREPG